MNGYRRVEIPITCPRCSGRMISIRYDAPLSILSFRSWQVCTKCGFERTSDDFKKSLLTV